MKKLRLMKIVFINRPKKQKFPPNNTKMVPWFPPPPKYTKKLPKMPQGKF
jgi:hypothetical protein